MKQGKHLNIQQHVNSERDSQAVNAAMNSRKERSSMYGRGSGGKDELYQSMNEALDDDEHESQEQTSIRDLPKEVMQAMEMENMAHVEIPNKGTSSMLEQKEDTSIFE